jgi:hypothetical protein
VAVQALGQRVGLRAREVEQRRVHEDEMVAVDAQVARVGAEPERIARVAAVGEQRVRGDARVGHAPAREAPHLEARLAALGAAAAREERLERRQALGRRCGGSRGGLGPEEIGDREMDVHERRNAV